jgi:ubiquinone biosynthesis protein UbiJ
MWSILALGAVERIIHHVIDLDAITRIQLNQLQGKMLRVVIDSPQLSVDVSLTKKKYVLNLP